MEEELKQRSVMKEEQDKMLQVLQRENVHSSEEGELHCESCLHLIIVERKTTISPH